MKRKHTDIVIVGAGLTGSLLAIFLARYGYNIELYEKRNDLRSSVGSERRRTIAMSLSSRGIHSLKSIGIFEAIREFLIFKAGRMTYELDGNQKVQMYGNGSDTICTINRNSLNCTLLTEAAKLQNVSIIFQHELQNIDLANKALFFVDGNGNRQAVSYSYCFGTDGVHSRLRSKLAEKGALEYDKKELSIAYKEVFIPPKQNEYQLDPRYVHVWPSSDSMFVGLPGQNKAFLCTLFFDLRARNSFKDVENEEQLKKVIESTFPSLATFIGDFTQDFFSNPTTNLFEVNCSQWNHLDNVLLLGDAAHAFAPFYAMGMNVCFEDCLEFANLLTLYNGNMGRTISDFTLTRKKETDAMGTLASKNYQTLLSSRKEFFHLRWQLERKLWEIYPNEFIPEYVMIAFTLLPFSDILKRCAVNEWVLDELFKEFPEYQLRNAVMSNKFFKSSIVRRILDNSKMVV